MSCKPNLVAGIIFTLTAAIVLSGCSKRENAATAAPPPVDKQIVKVQSDPNIPPQAKAMIEQSIRNAQNNAANAQSAENQAASARAAVHK